MSDVALVMRLHPPLDSFMDFFAHIVICTLVGAVVEGVFGLLDHAILR